jgi:predicted DCC family thiol-disulfide oxidoreductase YuxK
MAASQRIADKLASHAAYSYRSDPNVPAFPDERPVIVYDGVCVLCSRSMRIIARGDRDGRFRFMSAQSLTGQALFRHYRLDVHDFETVLLIDNGRAYGKIDMISRVATRLGGIYRPLSVLAVMRLLPGRVQDWCYDLIARNRYAWFGRTDVCMLPDEGWRARVID